MFFIIYDKNTYEVKKIVSSLNKEDLIIKENEAVLDNSNIKDFSQKDIRAYNKDGTVKSLEQQVKEKIITLKDNEIIDKGIIKELNKNYEEDYIILIERGLEKLEDTKKITANEEGKKYITEKSIEEKYNEGLITKEKYNAYIVNQRQNQYSQNLDGARAELLEDVLNSLANQGLLNTSQMEILKSLQKTRADIKEQYPKQS